MSTPVSRSPFVIVNRILFKGITRLSIYFRYNPILVKAVKSIPGRHYLSEEKLWHIPDNETSTRELVQALSPHARLIWRIPNPGSPNTQKKAHASRPSKTINLSDTYQNHLEKYRLYLQSKRRAPSTIHTYTNFMAQLLDHFNAKQLPLSEFTNEHIQAFSEKKLSPKLVATSTHRQFISALKSFILCFPALKIDPHQLSYPKKESKLPTVLSIPEIIDLIRSTPNLKHRAITALLYASGLRIGELLHLKLTQIDFDRRQIIIRNAKGNKDRYVPLAESSIPLIKNYLATYRPISYFAEGKPGEAYSASSIRAFLKRNCYKAGIHKRVSPHTLRHSYATHLMENGVDIRYIQELLGHSRPETTMVYTHVSTRSLLSIKSPLDIAARHLSSTKNPNSNLLLSQNIHGTNETE